MLALVLLGPSAAVAARGKHTTKAHFACTSEDEYEGLVILAAGGSSTHDEFQKELVRALMADECTTFHAGEAVNVLATREGMTKIRFKGRGPRAWWTSPTVIQ